LPAIFLTTCGLIVVSPELSELFHERQDGTGRDTAEHADGQRLEEWTESKDNKQWNERRQSTCQLTTTTRRLMD